MLGVGQQQGGWKAMCLAGVLGLRPRALGQSGVYGLRGCGAQHSTTPFDLELP